MDITILLALLGVGLLAALAGGSSGSDPEVDPPPVDETPDEVTVVSGEKAFGGGGNDLITADGPVDGSSVFGGDGDDTITLDATHSEIGGGTGDDVFTLSGGADTVFGGEGDDALTTGPDMASSGVYGGDGQDHLTLQFDTTGNDPASSFYGGNGADTFSADLTLGANPGTNGSAPLLRGGNDDDIFDLTIDLAAVRPGAGTAPQLVATIDDFDPGNDQLHIDAQGATLKLVEAGNGAYTDVILTYAATATAPAAQGIIRLTGITDLDPRDIGLDPVTTPDPIVVGSHETVTGGTGDDQISSDGLVTGSTVSGGSGNDAMDLNADFSRINGDNGNDTITLHGYHSSIFGGNGNDTMTTGTDAVYARLFGGAGNDTLNLDYSQFSSIETPATDAGDGNDQFNVKLTLNIDPDKAPDGPDLEGGAGKDVFDLNVQLGDVYVPDSDTELERGLTTIKDFEPGRDILQIDAQGATVSLREAANGRDTEVVLTYPATADAPEVMGLITLERVTGLSLADIVVA
jgi:RTX calcium-binding nonapeptide repeat (4 copies)